LPNICEEVQDMSGSHERLTLCDLDAARDHGGAWAQEALAHQ
jgi:hypothetical protein